MILQAVFSRPSSRAGEVLDKPYIKIRAWKDAVSPFYHAEFYTKTQVFHKKFTIEEFNSFLKENAGTTFRTVVERTEDKEITVMSNRHGEIRTVEKKLEKTDSTHFGNKEKKYLLPQGKPIPFMVKLGLMSAEGKVIAQKYDKFRQINRFLEFIEDTLKEMHCANGEGFSEERPLRIVDFGCGKSYLTFAVYYYLVHVKGIPVHITGLDLKEDVIELCSNLAKEFDYTNLEFFVGDVANFDHKEKPDIIITLHACDTATDYAMNYAVRNSARAILCVPCCQHEINTQLGARKDYPDEGPFSSLLKYGIIRERLSALATDVLRAECLEQNGYSVQVMEFIDMEHTPKNLLIRAVKKSASTGKEKSLVRSKALLGELGVSQTLFRLLSD
ncbi:MAG: SAM-dependent methyltransferase [Treponema sp.]|nr:SAM-dependent methyltransferase [Treponema sp.]